MVLLAAFMLLGSVGAFAGKFTLANTNELNKKLVERKLLKSYSVSFTDGCGTEWTITASCGSCTNVQLQQAIEQWKEDNLTEFVDDEPCFDAD